MKKSHKILLAYIAISLTVIVFGHKNGCEYDLLNSVNDVTEIHLPRGCVIQIHDEIIVTSDVTIYGNESTIKSSGEQRLFYIYPDASLHLENLTLTGVHISGSDNGQHYEGGVIYNSGKLFMKNVTIANNTVDTVYGVGLFNAQEGYVEIQHSIFEDNHGVSGEGGAIYNKGYLELSFTEIVHNSFLFDNSREFNSTKGRGAGIRSAVGANLIISYSNISHNLGNSYVAIDNSGYLQIDHTRINDNQAIRINESYGGSTAGILNSGTAFIQSSEITNNTSAIDRSGINNRSRLWINNSIISDNTSTETPESSCSGLYQSTFRLLPLSVTVQNNYWGASNGPGGDGPGDGDGVCNVDIEAYSPWLVEPPIH